MAAFRQSVATFSPVTIVALSLIASSALPVLAQRRDIRPDRAFALSSLTVVARSVDFSKDSEEVAATNLDFSGPSLGVMYSFPPEWRVSGQLFLGYSAESESDKNVYEGEFLLWHRIALGTPSRTETFLMFTPLFSYRHMTIPESPVDSDAFGVFRIGLGLGLGLNSRLGSRTVLIMRALPVATGTTNKKQQERLFPRVDYLVDGGLMLHFERLLSDRTGLSLGFQMRAQRISVVSADFFPDSPDSWVSFGSIEPGVRLGINW